MLKKLIVDVLAEGGEEVRESDGAFLVAYFLRVSGTRVKNEGEGVVWIDARAFNEGVGVIEVIKMRERVQNEAYELYGRTGEEKYRELLPASLIRQIENEKLLGLASSFGGRIIG
jgi:hypothetical protein